MPIQVINAADWKRYNANTRDASVGDCVKRALTIAYSMDYDEVSKELNKIKRKKNASAYNIEYVYHDFCSARGTRFHHIAQSDFPGLEGQKTITVADVCDAVSSGTYLLEVCEKPKKYSNHICVVVDGVLFDSWDSRNWYVSSWGVVTSSKTEIYTLDCSDIMQEIDDYLMGYLDKLNAKKYSKYGVTFSTSSPTRDDRHTYEFTLILRFNDFPPKDSKYSRCKSWGHDIIVKLNPRMTIDENASILKKKVAQKAYDWIYNVMKDVEEAMSASEFDWESSNVSKYTSSEEKKLIMKLPEWCRKLIRYVEYNPSAASWGGYVYELTMNPLPDDPHPERGNVSFYADTLTELKDQIKAYQEDGSRYNYEY